MDRFKFNPPRVLMVCLSREWGGADVRVVQTARHLEDSRHDYAVMALAGSPLARRLEEAGLSVELVHRRRWSPLITFDIVSAARRLNATVIDAHNVQSQYWAALASQFMPHRGLVATVHSDYNELSTPYRKRVRRVGALRACNRSGASFIGVSSLIVDGLTDIGISEERIRCSWNGVEPADGELALAPIREEAGWPEDAKVIAMIGRIEEIKGHAYLIDALARLRAEGHDDLYLFCVGQGPSENKIKRLTEVFGLADRVHFAGFRKDVANILAATDVHMMPSLSEGLPYALLEASELYVPTIMSRVGAASSLYEHGRSIYFTEPRDVPGLMSAITEMFDDPNRIASIGRGARSVIDRRLNMRRMLAETLEVYNYAEFSEPVQAGDPAE